MLRHAHHHINTDVSDHINGNELLDTITQQIQQRGASVKCEECTHIRIEAQMQDE